ncbi:glycosyl hydrolase, partial [Streptomyces sp. NPDC057654]
MGTTERRATDSSTHRTRAWRPVLAALLGTGLMLTGGHPAAAGTAPDHDSAKPLPVRLTGDADADRAHDGDPTSYAKGSTSHWVGADLGATRRLDRVELRLPGAAQRIQLQGSDNGRDFVDLSDARARRGKVTLPLGGAPLRHLRLAGAQRVGELAVYGAVSGDTTPPKAPRGVRLDGTTLRWERPPEAAGYDVYADGRLRAGLPATAMSWQDTMVPGGTEHTTAYTVRARDAAGNASPDSRTASRAVAAGKGSTRAAFTPPSGRPVPGPGPKRGKAATGATMPYRTVEAESAATGGGAQVIGPNRKIGDLAGEASGRKAVTLR